MKTPRSHSTMMFLVAGTALVLVASIAWHFLGGRVSSEGGKLVAQATQLESQGDAAGAEEAYRQILASDSANFEARRALARLADERAAAQEASMELASANLPPESPEIVAEKMAAAQAQMEAMMGQFTARSATPVVTDSKVAALQPKTDPASPATASAPASPPAALPPPASASSYPVPVFQPAIPPPGVPLSVTAPAMPPAIMPPAPTSPDDSRTLYEYIDGINPGTGTFTLTSAGRWIERCPDGNIFEFEEKARQPGFIELHDATRQVGIRLQASGTLVHQPGVADGGWQELYPGGWRDKTRPSSPKVIVRMIPEDVGMDVTKRAMKEKPADASRAKSSQASSAKPPGNDELPSAALSPEEGKAMNGNRALDPQAQDLKLLQGVWECVATYKDNVSVPDYVGIKAVIQGTRLTWIYPKPGGKDEIEEARFNIDATQAPKHFDWHYVNQGPDQLRRRIYFVDENTLRWGSGGKAGAHPLSFEQSSWEFRCKRVRPADGDTASQIQMKPTN